MPVDISPIENAAVQFITALLGLAGLWVLLWLKAKLKIQTSAAFDDRYNYALNTLLQLGFTKSEAEIKEHGWDHVETKSTIIQHALEAADKFPDYLAAKGIVPKSDGTFSVEDLKKLEDALRARLPDVAARLATSPATPPAPELPAQPAVVINAPASNITHQS